MTEPGKDRLPAEPMSAVDAAWLGMDRPDNPMVITAIVELRGRGGVQGLAKVVAQRLLACPRFRQRPQPPLWVDDEDIDLRYHVRVRRLRDAEDSTFNQALAEEMTLPVDLSRPLWRCSLLVRRRSSVVLLFRAHHALADGVALMDLLLATRDGAAPAWPEPAARTVPHGPLGGLLRRLESVNQTLEAAAVEVAADLHDPARLAMQLHDGLAGAVAVARVLRLPDAEPAVLRQPLSGHRNLAWSSELRLLHLKGIARAHGAHINDVFLAALAGAFGRVLQEDGVPLPADLPLRVSIPVNLRTAADAPYGNRFGLVLVELPVGIVEWRERLQACAQRMQALKESGEARAVLAGLSLAGHLPRGAGQSLVELVAAKSVAVVSNLPGPRDVLRIGGMRVAGMVFWPPQAGGIGIGVSLLSYAGSASIGVSADRNALAEPARLVRAFEAEIAAMERAGKARSRTRSPRSAAGIDAGQRGAGPPGARLPDAMSAHPDTRR